MQKREKRAVALQNLDLVEPYGETAKGAMFSTLANVAGNIASTTAATHTKMAEEDAVEKALDHAFEYDEQGNPIHPGSLDGIAGFNTRKAYDDAINERYLESIALSLDEKLSDAHNSNLYNEAKYRQDAAIIIGSIGDQLAEGFDGRFSDISSKLSADYAAKIGYRSAVRSESDARRALRSNIKSAADTPEAIQKALAGNFLDFINETGIPTFEGDEGTFQATVKDEAASIEASIISKHIQRNSIGTAAAVVEESKPYNLPPDEEFKLASTRTNQLSILNSASLTKNQTTKAIRAFNSLSNPDTKIDNWSSLSASEREGVVQYLGESSQLTPEFILEGLFLNQEITPVGNFLLETQLTSGVLNPALGDVLNRVAAGGTTARETRMATRFYDSMQGSADNPKGWIAKNPAAAAALDEASFFFSMRTSVDTWEKDSPNAIAFEELQKNQSNQPGVDFNKYLKDTFLGKNFKPTSEANQDSAIRRAAEKDVEDILDGALLDGSIRSSSMVQRYLALISRGTMTREDAKNHLSNIVSKNLFETDHYVNPEGEPVERVWHNLNVIGDADLRTDGKASVALNKVMSEVIKASSIDESIQHVGEVRYQVNKGLGGAVSLTPFYFGVSVTNDIFPPTTESKYNRFDTDVNVSTFFKEIENIYGKDAGGFAFSFEDNKIRHKIEGLQRKRMQVIQSTDSSGIHSFEKGQYHLPDLTPDQRLDLNALDENIKELKSKLVGYNKMLDDKVEEAVQRQIIRMLEN